jgi:hypothetical protein
MEQAEERRRTQQSIDGNNALDIESHRCLEIGEQ